MVRFGLTLLCLAALGRASPASDTAIQFYRDKNYAEAESALRKVVADEPANAAAAYYLGQTLKKSSDRDAFEKAVPWLQRASDLAPTNSEYIDDYGVTCLKVAGQNHSVFYATRGRTIMRRAVAMNPDDLPARYVLMEFYARAPWPLGGANEALGQAREIGRRNPTEGIEGYLLLADIFEKKKDSHKAKEACNGALRLDPKNQVARSTLSRLEAIE